MHGPYTHISDYIRNVATEIAAAASRVLRGTSNILATKKIQLTGAAYTQQPVQIGEDKVPITLPVIVDPTKHRHTITTITGGVEPTANTVVVRNVNSKIKSSGTSAISTGYVLKDGKDLSTMFVRTTEPRINCINKDIGSGNVITKLEIIREQNNIILIRTWGTIE